MPLFACATKVRYSYTFDRGDTRKYREVLVIEADNETEAEKAVEFHYETLHHGSDSHHYELLACEVNPFMSAVSIRQKHAEVMADYLKYHDHKKD